MPFVVIGVNQNLGNRQAVKMCRKCLDPSDKFFLSALCVLSVLHVQHAADTSSCLLTPSSASSESCLHAGLETLSDGLKCQTPAAPSLDWETSSSSASPHQSMFCTERSIPSSFHGTDTHVLDLVSSSRGSWPPPTPLTAAVSLWWCPVWWNAPVVAPRSEAGWSVENTQRFFSRLTAALQRLEAQIKIKKTRCKCSVLFRFCAHHSLSA